MVQRAVPELAIRPDTAIIVEATTAGTIIRFIVAPPATERHTSKGLAAGRVGESASQRLRPFSPRSDTVPARPAIDRGSPAQAPWMRGADCGESIRMSAHAARYRPG